MEFGPNCRVWDWKDRNQAMANVSLLINTTNCGMVGQPPLDLSLELLPKSAVVHDIVYIPLMTKLLEQAQARGNPTINGLEMLLHQACPAFKSWFGVEPEITTDLRKIIHSSSLVSKK